MISKLLYARHLFDLKPREERESLKREWEQSGDTGHFVIWLEQKLKREAENEK